MLTKTCNGAFFSRAIAAVVTTFMFFTLSACSGNSSEVENANNKVCEDVLAFMKGSGYMQGTRESLMNAVTQVASYQPDAVADWVTYVSPQDGSYVPSLYDNDNSLYQSLYRLQTQALDYMASLNAGAYYGEWRYFQKECGVEE